MHYAIRTIFFNFIKQIPFLKILFKNPKSCKKLKNLNMCEAVDV